MRRLAGVTFKGCMPPPTHSFPSVTTEDLCSCYSGAQGVSWDQQHLHHSQVLMRIASTQTYWNRLSTVIRPPGDLYTQNVGETPIWNLQTPFCCIPVSLIAGWAYPFPLYLHFPSPSSKYLLGSCLKQTEFLKVESTDRLLSANLLKSTVCISSLGQHSGCCLHTAFRYCYR